MSTSSQLARWRKLARSYEMVAQLRAQSFDDRRLGLLEKARLQLEYQFLPHYGSDPPFWRVLLRQLTARRRVLPDFAVIGPIKSGTSDLAIHLMLHPCITTPLAKEFQTLAPDRWRPFYPTVREQQRHVRTHGVVRSGYFPPYLHRVRCAERLAKAIPGAKIVLALRDPVERAFSHWKWEVLLSGKAVVDEVPYLGTFSAFCQHALDSFPDYPTFSACGFPILETGIYYKATQVWFQHFGRENVLVLDMGAYFRDRQSVLGRICDFLGIERAKETEAMPRLNENPLSLPRADGATDAKLASFYEPYNEKLFESIGERFPWRSA